MKPSPDYAEQPLSQRILRGARDSSTLMSQRCANGVKPVKATEALTEEQERNSELLVLRTEGDSGCEDLFNSTVRLAPGRVWTLAKNSTPAPKDSQKQLVPLLPARVSSTQRKPRPPSLDRPSSAERRMAGLPSRRIIRTGWTRPKALRACAASHDLLQPSQLRK